MSKEMYKPSEEIISSALVNEEQYREMYKKSVDNPEEFWRAQGQKLEWFKTFTKVKDVSFVTPNVSIKWFEDGVLNASVNCIDRHLKEKGNDTAIIWESDDPLVDKKITFNQLHENVCKLANVYKNLGVEKGDRIILYMPMIPEAAYAILASARIGAVHSIVFAGFSPEALSSRIQDCGAKLVVTADEAPRGGKNTPLKVNVDEALSIC